MGDQEAQQFGQPIVVEDVAPVDCIDQRSVPVGIPVVQFGAPIDQRLDFRGIPSAQRLLERGIVRRIDVTSHVEETYGCPEDR